MRFNNRRGLRMFAVAALVPMMALAQGKTQAATAAKPQDAVTQQVTERVRDFLAAVPKNDPAVFQDFFADDVIYTRATGVTVTKAEILKNIDVRAAVQPEPTYTADDFTVHPYGDMAVVNFRLVMHNVEDGKPVTAYYRNTGTFMKRHGKWQAVAWQATKAPEASR